MAKRKLLALSDLDDKLHDGLKFCLKAYDLLAQIQAEPDGIGKIRLLDSKREKRLLEELLPLTRYIQDRYDAGNRMKIRWLSGSQPYDAIIWTPSKRVKNTSTPRKIFVEVTTSRHEHTHFSRRQLHETGGSFGPKGIRINKVTGVPDSAPHVSSGTENISDLACQILARIGAKANKAYPINTTLIVNCETNTVILEDDWKQAIAQVENADIHKTFREVFLIDLVGRHTATLRGARKAK